MDVIIFSTLCDPGEYFSSYLVCCSSSNCSRDKFFTGGQNNRNILQSKHLYKYLLDCYWTLGKWKSHTTSLKNLSRGHLETTKKAFNNKLNKKWNIFNHSVSHSAANHLRIYFMFPNYICCNYIKFRQHCMKQSNKYFRKNLQILFPFFYF